jgi:uncharacterized protein (DUF1697 family)
MSIHIALLRGINVGGNNMIAMAELRQLMEKLKFAGARSLLQSGNLVFTSQRLTGDALERHLEAETAKRFDVTVDYLVRTADEWKKIIARNPFPKEAKLDPGHLLVMCLKAAPQAKDVKNLQAAIKGREVIHADGKQLYLVYPDGVGKSKLTNTLIERTLGTRGTARNWNTALKLEALVGSKMISEEM